MLPRRASRRRFGHKAFPIERREVIRELIGEEAEFLAYVFCVTDRPSEFLANINSSEIVVTDNHEKRPLRLSREQLSKLFEIEAANLLEQGGDVKPLVEQLSFAEISIAAKRAVADYLARGN